MTLKEIQRIIKDFEKSPLMLLELEMNEFKLKLSKNNSEYISDSQAIKPSNETHQLNESIKELKKNGNEVKSELVGTFYDSPTINGNPYVKVGDYVKKDQVICIIEAMKIMNEITSPFDGIVKEIRVKNGEVVGYNQIMMVIE